MIFLLNIFFDGVSASAEERRGLAMLLCLYFYCLYSRCLKRKLSLLYHTDTSRHQLVSNKHKKDKNENYLYIADCTLRKQNGRK